MSNTAAWETLGSFLREVSQRTGLSLQLDDAGVCGLRCAEGLQCGVTLLDDSRVGFFAPMLTLPVENRGAALEALLARNLFGLHPTGAALGLDEDTSEVLFCWPVDLNCLDSASFATRLGEFITCATQLKKELS